MLSVFPRVSTMQHRDDNQMLLMIDEPTRTTLDVVDVFGFCALFSTRPNCVTPTCRL